MDRREYVSAHLDVSPGTEKRLETPSSDTPFRIVLLGDFSGRGNRAVAVEPRLRGRKTISIDLDNYEEALGRLRSQLELPGPDEPIRMQFGSLDDFHPEALYKNVALFRELRAQQDALLESPTPRPSRPAPRAPAAPMPELLNAGSLLDDIVSGTESSVPREERPRDAWQQHIHDIVAPHVEAAPSARQEELAAQVEDTIVLAMRMILHHPEFQELEAAWRSVDFLIRRLELGGDLQLHLIDLSKRELLEDLAKADDDLSSTGLHRLLVEESGGTAGEMPWAMIAGLYAFEADPIEIRALGAMGRLAREAGAPFLCSLSPRFMGTESFHIESDDWQTPIASEAEEEWTALRSSPEASWIAASLPRFILRDPYTKDSVDSFRFEEMTTPPEHSDYLWGNPAVAVVALVGESFSADGWDVRLRNTQIGSLAVHSWKSDGEVNTTPCAECWMTERLADRFLSRGIMPLASVKHSDSVRLIRLQSIANPAASLRARWS